VELGFLTCINSSVRFHSRELPLISESREDKTVDYAKKRADQEHDYTSERVDIMADYARQKADAEIGAKKFVLETLLGNRFNTNSNQFLEALNKVAIVFHDSTEVKAAIKRYMDHVEHPALDRSAHDYRFVEAVKAMYKNLNLDVQPLDDDFFLKPFAAEKPFERNSTQDSVFRSLMATRAAQLSSEHVRALNMIEIAFYGGGEKEKAVRDTWKAYHYHLNDRSYTGERQQQWGSRKEELLIDLLYSISVCLEYDFDRTQIKTSGYSPQWHATVDNELSIIWTAVASFLSGIAPLKPIPVIIKQEVTSVRSENTEQQVR
jgi:uncharacterized protein DUF6680